MNTDDKDLEKDVAPEDAVKDPAAGASRYAQRLKAIGKLHTCQ